MASGANDQSLKNKTDPVPKPGPHWTPLDDDCTVFTVGLEENYSPSGDPSPLAFNPSSKEREQDPWTKSVWEDDLSSPAQIVGSVLNNPKRRIAVHIDVEDVRDVDAADMDVVWDHLDQYPSLDDNFPGADGHCAIIGWPEGGGEEKKRRNLVRKRLAEKAHTEEEIELEETEAGS